MSRKWKWANGRLARDGESLSVNEAFERQLVDKPVEEACKGILKPNTERTLRDIHRVLADKK